MIFLTIDVGNTSTTCGLFDDRSLLLTFRFPTRTLTHQGLTTEAITPPLAGSPTPSTIAIASVVPWATDELIGVLDTNFPGVNVITLTSVNLPLEVHYDHPSELGTDRLLGALAAHKLWGEREGRPTISIDLGTATTYDCITAHGVYLGGAIAPGIELASEALSARAVQLPTVTLEFPPSIVGRTTVESMQSGIMFGAIAGVEGMVARFASEVFPSEQPLVVATGGLSRLLVGHTHVFDHVEPDLVLYGILFAAEVAIAPAAPLPELSTLA